MVLENYVDAGLAQRPQARGERLRQAGRIDSGPGCTTKPRPHKCVPLYEFENGTLHGAFNRGIGGSAGAACIRVREKSFEEVAEIEEVRQNQAHPAAADVDSLFPHIGTIWL